MALVERHAAHARTHARCREGAMGLSRILRHQPDRSFPRSSIFPGTQPFRLYIRIASFVISFATLLWWAVAVAKTSRTHPAQPWIFAAMAYVVVMFFHPLTSSTFAGLAQFVLYLSVIAPIFWAGTFVRTPERLARLDGAAADLQRTERGGRRPSGLRPGALDAAGDVAGHDRDRCMDLAP